MATISKTPKDKPHGVIPKLVPRQTAASAARAALIATNRNVGPPPKLASRSQSMPVPAKTKSPRNNFKADSKPDLKVSEDAAESGVCDSSLPDGQMCSAESNEHEISDDIDQAQRYRPNTPGSIRSSRPPTPHEISRPETPHIKSRPTTPRVSSRPITPAYHPHGSTPSRPNTPHQQHRPKTPVHSTASMPSPGSNEYQVQHFKMDDDVRVAFSKTQKRFHLMKKELDMKQQAVLQVFDDLRMLRERMNQEGIIGAGEDGVSNEELLVMNIGNWTAEEISQMVRDSITPAATEKVTELLNSLPDLDENAISELNSKIVGVPANFSELCLQSFAERAELVDWIKNLLNKYEEKDGPSFDRIEQYNAQGLELCHTLRDLKDHASETVLTFSQIIQQACRERSALMAIGQSLVREIACLRQDLETKYKPKSNTENESVKLLVDTRKELEEERAAKAAIKDKMNTTESQLKHARLRISKMEKQLRESDASIVSLTGTVKSLEEQSRQKETQLEARARKLRESLKTGEVTSNHIAQQRDLLIAETVHLKEQIENLKKESATTEKELTKKIKELSNDLLEQKMLTEKEKELKKAAEEALAMMRQEVEELKAKNIELENSRPNPDLPTDREMDLWAQLQATKEALRLTEDEVTSCKREKIRFLETLTKLGESDNKVGIQQKLAAELQSKEEMTGQMQIQIREMTKTIKLNDQKLQQYEQYVHSLQEHNQAVLNGCEDGQNAACFQNLQQEIMNLKMNLLESVNRNEELTELLNQKDQQLNQQEKTSQAQAIVIKIREELISMLQNKETEQSQELIALQQDVEHRMRIVEEVNKQIAAKAQEIQELFASLENKQQQIYRLEKIVLALEEQHRRAQVQRTRHEEKISALEHQIASGCGRREKKFSFF